MINTVEPTDRWTAAETTLRKTAPLIDERTGIIRMVYENPAPAGGIQIFGFGAVLADTQHYGLPNGGNVCGSTSARRPAARAAAIGEAVERYSARHQPEDLIMASTGELRERFVDPHQLGLYRPEQYSEPGFAYAPVDRATVLGWTRGWSLTRGEPVLVPATAVYFPYQRPDAEPLFMQQTTSGLGCGNTITEACVSGLLEVVERDADMLAWMHRPGLRRWDLRTATDPQLLDIIDRMSGCRDEVFVVDASTDLGIPVAVASAFGPPGPAAVLSSAAALDPQHAARRALEELGQGMPWVRSMVARGYQPPPIDQLHGMEDHVLWAAAPERAGHIRVLGGVGPEQPLPDRQTSMGPRATLRELIERIRRAGFEAIAVDVTSPDIAAVDLRVARVLVPGLQPLCFGSAEHRWLPRTELPTSSLFPTAAATTTGPLDLSPHPFP